MDTEIQHWLCQWHTERNGNVFLYKSKERRRNGTNPKSGDSGEGRIYIMLRTEIPRRVATTAIMPDLLQPLGTLGFCCALRPC